jgi:hypothetical protein
MHGWHTVRTPHLRVELFLVNSVTARDWAKNNEKIYIFWFLSKFGTFVVFLPFDFEDWERQRGESNGEDSAAQRCKRLFF